MSQSKKVACKREYLNKLLFIEKPLKCGLENCRGAHNYQELTINSEVKKFDSTNWKDIDFIELYKTIYLQVKSSLSNINKYSELSLTKTLPEMNFIELLNFWREFAVIMRREKKNYYDKESRAKSFGFKTPGDIPILDLKEHDNFAWSLWRSFHCCEEHEKFLNNVSSGMNKYDLQSHVCFHSLNCKNGTHHYNRQICSDDLLYGKCDCLSKKDSDNKIRNLNKELKNIIYQINKKVKYSIPKLENCDEKLRNLVIQSRQKIVELERAHRKIHLTELGVKPIDEKIINFKKTFLKPKTIIIFRDDDLTNLQKLNIIRGKFQF